ncbi:patatin-like phospholipase [Rhizoctonia solani AG-3 Rhs1AP]|uniref:Patatin-like phospholipase n=1 Tax=Rhizoctonia solani AG-3 Rhs1AP TaxID=1086054 RepID=X8J066_9AGAM|nr:patatin-like phospholipase [Rhizoctonia solani AG-3 Rhs1AP]
MSMSTPQETNNWGSPVAIREENATPTREGDSPGITMALRDESKPLRLLSLDGGGIRGLSSLYILREFMRRVQTRVGTTEAILPCDYFDMICGTSTGGLIAIMLGKLRMSVDEAIGAYRDLSQSIFGETKWIWKEGRYSAQVLEQAIALIVGKRAQTLGWAEAANLDITNCKVFVCALNANSIDAPSNIRTYKAMGNELDDLAVWEAARATSAAPYFFKPMVVKPRPDIDRHFEIDYIDGGLRLNNPINQLLREASQQFSNRKVRLILSLGTGAKNTIQLPRAGFIPKPQWYTVFQLHKKIALNCEKHHQVIERRFTQFRQGSNVYFRFNVDRGMRHIGLEEWTMLKQIKENTEAYMDSVSVNPRIDRAVELSLTEDVQLTIQQAAGL